MTTITTHRPGTASPGAPPEVRDVPPVTPVAPEAVATLMARWRRMGATFVVVDQRGRHRDQLADGRLDLTRASAADADWIDAGLYRNGYVLLDACNVPRERRPLAVGRALAAVQGLRTRTGRPEWIVVEDAQDLLRSPDLPPHALRLADGGYCLVARDGAVLPAHLRAGAAFDVRVSQPGLELALIPPRPASAG
jgi:hypothetical protein